MSRQIKVAFTEDFYQTVMKDYNPLSHLKRKRHEYLARRQAARDQMSTLDKTLGGVVAGGGLAAGTGAFSMMPRGEKLLSEAKELLSLRAAADDVNNLNYHGQASYEDLLGRPKALQLANVDETFDTANTLLRRGKLLRNWGGGIGLGALGILGAKQVYDRFNKPEPSE